MEYWQEEIRHRLVAFQRGIDTAGLAVSIKLRVRGCFCREHHAPVANRLIDEFQMRHPLDPRCCQYVEHESGPELLLYLGLAVGVLAIAREGLGVLKSAIELVTAIVKARSDGRRQGDNQDGPILIVVRGFDSDDTLYEKKVLEADLDAPPTAKTIEESLTGVIQLIAEERARRGAKGGPSPKRTRVAKRKKKRRGGK